MCSLFCVSSYFTVKILSPSYFLSKKISFIFSQLSLQEFTPLPPPGPPSFPPIFKIHPPSYVFSPSPPPSNLPPPDWVKIVEPFIVMNLTNCFPWHPAHPSSPHHPSPAGDTQTHQSRGSQSRSPHSGTNHVAPRHHYVTHRIPSDKSQGATSPPRHAPQDPHSTTPLWPRHRHLDEWIPAGHQRDFSHPSVSVSRPIVVTNNDDNIKGGRGGEVATRASGGIQQRPKEESW